MKKFGMAMVDFALDHPKKIVYWVIGLSIFFLAITVLPSLWPQTFPQLHTLKVDTDPENMLPHDEPARIFHDQEKRKFSMYEMVVVGVVNESPDGVFNPKTLSKIFDLAEFAKELDGVIRVDVMSLSTVDDIQQKELGSVSFNWLMPEPPSTQEQALLIRERALRIPFYKNTLLSEDSKAVALYLPITAKDKSFAIYQALNKKIATFEKNSADEFHIAGLPVAEDVFGVEMFMQMAIAAPLAMLVIFLIMLYFFKSISLVVSPLITAFVAVIWTMGLLISTGNTVHIMSSMIPIFIMPIAVLDAIHILSEFFDRYNQSQSRRELVRQVIDVLYRPMLFTSVTTMVGFASLALTPIPPVQIFGIYVAFGVFCAWILTMTFIPAFIMLLSEKRLLSLLKYKNTTQTKNHLLAKIGRFANRRSSFVTIGSAVVFAIAIYGLTKIKINDNPTKWFEPSHSIRIADFAMNRHLAGTYMAYLTLKAPKDSEAFKSPEVLNQIIDLQNFIENQEQVGKTSSLTDIVKTVHRDLFLGNEEKFIIPSSSAGVAQVLLTYQNSHRPQDVWHFVTPEFDELNIWIQMKDGDNQVMENLVKKVDAHLQQKPISMTESSSWFGLTYINKIWQDKMVSGMAKAFMGSFAIVLLLMVFLFRSIRWGILSMIPLSFTIALIYGVIGFIGKDYDMPVAVLSSLSLGLAVDYAIHFLARAKELMQTRNWQEVIEEMFQEPAQAIFRNIVVVGVGFLPLLVSPLVPYQTVGFLIASILTLAGFASLVILPAMIKIFISQPRKS